MRASKRPRAPLEMRARKVAAYVTGLLALVSFSRAASLFLESVAAERAERDADVELLRLCQAGDARGSAKMRTACLQAQSDRASPIVLKAVVRSVTTAWNEFRETVSSPLGLASVLLFLLSSMVLPVLPWIRAFCSAFGAEPDDDHGRDDIERHVIVVGGDQPRPGLRKRVVRMLTGPKGMVANPRAVDSPVYFES